MRRGLWSAAAAVGVAGALAATAAAARPLETAVMPVPGDDPEAVYPRVRAAGAAKVRVVLTWRHVGPNRPAGDQGDPANPAYRWDAVDREIVAARRHGLEPIVVVVSAPAWAERGGQGVAGSRNPQPAAYGRFAQAAARRYSGSFEGLPRVRYWQVWNEPNLTQYLNPRFVDGKPFSPGLYRELTNRFFAAVKSVHRDNVVIAGGTAPFRDLDLGIDDDRWGPLGFMRELLCLDRRLRATCSERVHFDVWAHHPYTSGGPTHKAETRGDVSLGDLPAMRRVLRAGYRAGRIASPRMPGFWATEFSWDSSPPDRYGVPWRLHRRWVAEAMYRMWRNGVTLVTWFSLLDQPRRGPNYWMQSGLYYWAANAGRAKAKPSLQAFRFPFVAFPERGRVRVWGRTPAGRRANVLVEQQFRGGWRRLAVVRTDRYGIFNRRLAGARTGWVRARTVDRGERAAPFSLAGVPDRRFNPFGESRP